MGQLKGFMYDICHGKPDKGIDIENRIGMISKDNLVNT